MKQEGRSAITIITELLFLFLPLLVIVLHSFARSMQTPILSRSEWSFAALVLFGQTVVRLTAGLLKSHTRKRWQYISLIITALIVFGIVPSAFTLSWVLDENVRMRIVIAQQILFWISVAAYLVFGTVGQMYLDEPDQRKSEPA